MAEHLWANDDACEFVVPTGDMGADALHWLLTGRWLEASCRVLPAKGAAALAEGGYRDVTAEVAGLFEREVKINTTVASVFDARKAETEAIHAEANDG